ncbi:MAG: hypothetical protein P9M13_07130 [Candidatus Ancaeobacter aquaticus]|nr:hypothetical protein [Candidatus Ancaeobacter aquaticus]
MKCMMRKVISFFVALVFCSVTSVHGLVIEDDTTTNLEIHLEKLAPQSIDKKYPPKRIQYLLEQRQELGNLVTFIYETLVESINDPTRSLMHASEELKNKINEYQDKKARSVSFTVLTKLITARLTDDDAISYILIPFKMGQKNYIFVVRSDYAVFEEKSEKLLETLPFVSEFKTTPKNLSVEIREIPKDTRIDQGMFVSQKDFYLAQNLDSDERTGIIKKYSPLFMVLFFIMFMANTSPLSAQQKREDLSMKNPVVREFIPSFLQTQEKNDEKTRVVYNRNLLSAQKAINWLTGQYNTKTHLCDSYEDEGGLNVLPELAPAGYTFDQALWAIAMDSLGSHKNASQVLRALEKLQMPNGSFYPGYNIHNPQIGYFTNNIHAGPIAFVVMANNFHVYATGGAKNGDRQFVAMAQNAANFLLTKQGPSGDVRSEIDGKMFASVEENIDCYSAFYYLYKITGDKKYGIAAQKMKKFLESMWDNERGFFYQGLNYTDNGTFYTNIEPAYDASVWGYLLLGDRGPGGEEYDRGLDFVQKELLVSNDTGFVHVSSDMRKYRDVFWIDPTIWFSIARLKEGNVSHAQLFFSNMLRYQTARGGFPLNEWKNRGVEGKDAHSDPVWKLYPFDAVHPAVAAVFYMKLLQNPDFNIFHPTLSAGKPIPGVTVKDVSKLKKPSRKKKGRLYGITGAVFIPELINGIMSLYQYMIDLSPYVFGLSLAAIGIYTGWQKRGMIKDIFVSFKRYYDEIDKSMLKIPRLNILKQYEGLKKKRSLFSSSA